MRDLRRFSQEPKPEDCNMRSGLHASEAQRSHSSAANRVGNCEGALAESVGSMGEMDVPKFNDLLIAVRVATVRAKRQPLNNKDQRPAANDL